MKIMITGATGFIGNVLLRQLLKQDVQIHALCRPSSDISFASNGNIKIFKGDITDRKSIEDCIKGCDQVYHLAAYAKNWAKDSALFFNHNSIAVKNILDSALKYKVNRVLFTSTSLIFGPSGSSLVNENTIRSVDAFTDYEASKIKAEEIISSYLNRGLEIITVYPTRLFGPGLLSEGNSVTKMIDLYLNGKFRFILGDGNAIGNYAFVEDVASGCISAMRHGKNGGKYILGGENLNFNELFTLIKQQTGKNYFMIHVPETAGLLYSSLMQATARVFNYHPQITPGWVKIFSMNWALSCNKAIREINYQIMPFSNALEKTINWINNNKHSRK